MKREPCRVSVNQPSTHQRWHRYHGMKGIAIDKGYHSDAVQVFFTEGNVISIVIARSALSY